MKKIICVFALTFVLFSCENKSDVQSDVDKLKVERNSLQNDVNRLLANKDSDSQEICNLSEKLKELKLIESGKSPKYILKLKLKQSHISLSISKHIKDAMNAIEFELPVDKDFYNSVSEGTEIVDEFRTGSLLLKGSFGSWEMEVVGKEIR